MTSLYEILGIARTATRDQVTAAYRRLAQDLHPDKEGGDAERFKVVQAAYDVLREPERRAAYDRDGFVADPNHIRQQAEALVADGLAGKMLAEQVSFSVSEPDPVRQVDHDLIMGLIGAGQANASAKFTRGKVVKSLARIQRKGGTNLVAVLLQKKLEEIDAFLARNLEQQAVLREAQKVINEYEWGAEPPAPEEAPVVKTYRLGY